MPEQWHLTLAFLADVADRHLDDLVDRLGRAAARRTPFAVTLAGGGAFPDPARAKVLFAGVETDGARAGPRLATGARAAAGKAGAEVDGGRFHPHVTLARTGRPVEATRWLRVLDAYRGADLDGATEVALVASHLGRGAAAAAALRGGRDLPRSAGHADGLGNRPETGPWQGEPRARLPDRPHPPQGARHVDLPAVDLTLDGPVGDRVFCLVDRGRGRVLRTVENPTLLQTVVDWDGGVLTVDAARRDGRAACPCPTGETLKVDYWGRVAAARGGGRPVGRGLLRAPRARRGAGRGPPEPGEVVYGASVSLVTTLVARPARAAARRRRWTTRSSGPRSRSTPTGEPPHVEDAWRRPAAAARRRRGRGARRRCPAAP